MSYTVKLVDFPDAPADVIATAESRFRRELDKLLGDGVEPALKAFENASESSADELTKDELALAATWAKAYEAAKTAGFRALGEADEAYFEIRLADIVHRSSSHVFPPSVVMSARHKNPLSVIAK